ncbi:GtrA family protein, partial [Patescibacteria group bacterium]|nr:GtrA family protein [Patescibacteria group bacterium]
LRLQDPKTQQFMKFAVVGFIGYIVNAVGLEVFYRAGLSPGPATAVATELAIINNFILNNIWTFAEKKIISWTRIPYKFLQFNFTSLGALIIQTIVVWVGTAFFGDQWRQILLIFAIGFLVLPYNFFMYTTFIWKTRKSKLFGWFQERAG